MGLGAALLSSCMHAQPVCSRDHTLLAAPTASASACPACLLCPASTPPLHAPSSGVPPLPAVCRLHVQAGCPPILHLPQVTVDDRVLEKLTIDEMKDIVAADPTQAFTVNEAEAKVS